VTNNHATRSVTVTGVDWTLAGTSGSTAASTTVAAGTSATVALPAGAVTFWDADTYRLTVHLSDGTTAVADGTTGFDPVEPAGDQNAPPIDLVTQGNPVKLNRAWNGPADLSGTVRFGYTAADLVVTADITDNVFSQNNTAPNLWLGDSIQFGVSGGLPGSDPGGATEIGAALLSTGPAAYTFGTRDGTPAGPTPGATVDITRIGTVTHYSVSVPWTSLGYSAAPTGVFSLSMLVNDNDNDSYGRADFIEWGSGIGLTKNNALYRPAQLIAE